MCEEKIEERLVRNLLSIIHRDGGQHLAELFEG